MALFSIRYQRALMDKRLTVPGIPARTRNRLWTALERFNHSWQTVDETNWSSWTDTVSETAEFLKREYGHVHLEAYNSDEGDSRGAVNLEMFVQRCYPRQCLDVVEAYYAKLDPEEGKEQFQQEANRVFQEENQPWRISEGQVFKLDSQFLEVEVLTRTEELLSANNYAGAHDEFREARNDLTAGETREAIAKAQNAFESTMKTILGVTSGNASQLIRALGDSGLFDDLPEEARAGFCEQVLMSLPNMGNKLGRHGQGAEVVDVPRHYAELAVHLAGSFIRMLVERQLELQASTPAPQPAPTENMFVPAADFPVAADDDIPF